MGSVVTTQGHAPGVCPLCPWERRGQQQEQRAAVIQPQLASSPCPPFVRSSCAQELAAAKQEDNGAPRRPQPLPECQQGLGMPGACS